MLLDTLGNPLQCSPGVPFRRENPSFSHVDTWQNFVTGLGLRGFDKRISTQIGQSVTLTEDDLNQLYRGDGFASRVINALTEDMVRDKFTVDGDTDNGIFSDIKAFGGFKKIEELVRWALLHGGSIGVIGIDDGGFLDEPVNVASIRKITHIHVYDRWRVSFTDTDLYCDPNNPKYGEPEFYTIYPISVTVQAVENVNHLSMREQVKSGRLQTGVSGFRVHETRILRFDGVQLPIRERLRNNGWHDSYLTKTYDRLRGLGESFSGVETIINEFMQGVLRIKGLASMIASGQEDLAVRRLHLIDQTKHILNTLLMDSEEEYKREFASVSGLPDLIRVLMLGLSAVSEIPVTRLFGESPAGLNATGVNDVRMYYDKIAGMQFSHMQTPLERLVKYVMLSKESSFKGKELDNWKIKFPSLYKLTDKEAAEQRKVQAETDCMYIGSAVLTPEEVALSRFGGNTYSTDTILDEMKGRNTIEEPTTKQEPTAKTKTKTKGNKSAAKGQ